VQPSPDAALLAGGSAPVVHTLDHSTDEGAQLAPAQRTRPATGPGRPTQRGFSLGGNPVARTRRGSIYVAPFPLLVFFAEGSWSFLKLATLLAVSRNGVNVR
jgi:hypothetical protein